MCEAGPRSRWAVAIALGLLAALLVGYATAPFGVGAAHFGVNNIGAAEGLLAGRGLSTVRGETFVLWGPLLPLSIAGLKLAGLAFLEGARWLTIGSAFFFVSLHSRLLLEAARSIWTPVAAGALLIVSPQFLSISVSLRSQPLFVALSFAGSWTLYRYLRQPRAGWLILTALLGAGLCLHRYDGVLNVVAYALVLALRPADASWMQRLRAAAFVSALPALALSAWLLRNLSVCGSLSGPRPSANGFLFENQLLDAWHTSSWWLVPWTENPQLRSVIAASLLGALIVGLALRLRRHAPLERRDALAACASFPLVYGLGLTAIGAVVWIDMIGERLLFPLLPCTLGLLLLALEELAVGAYASRRKLLLLPPVIGFLLLGIGLVWGIPSTVREIARMRTQGAGGIAGPNFSGRPLAAWLRAHPLQGAVYSNVPEFVLLFGDRGCVPLADGQAPSSAELLRRAPVDSYLVWELRGEAQRAGLAELQARILSQPVASLPDAVVLQLR